MDIKNLTAKQAREKLADRQEKLGKIFEEALVTGDSGQKQYDFNKVTCLGADVKGSIAVAERVQQLNLEANELAEHAETLEKAERAANDWADREKAVNRPRFPGGGGERDFSQPIAALKSLGELAVAEKSYKAWRESGGGGGVSLNFDEVYPSQLLAKAMQVETIGNKALMSTAAGYAPESVRLPGYVEAATRPLQVLDIIPLARTGQAAVPYMEETTRAHGAAETAEGGTYAESQFVFTARTSDVRKITDSLPVTDEQLEDVDFMESYINGRLTFGIRQRLDAQVVAGDGNAPNLRGLKNTGSIQTQARGTDPVPDVFFKAMTKVRVTGRATPTHHLIHPTDWEGIRLLRTADGVYIWGSPSEGGPERLWGLPAVQSEAGGAGWGMTGSFQPAWVSLFERRGVDLQVGYVGTQFGEGKRTVRGDIRAAFVVFRPAAFCEATGLAGQ